MKLPVALVALMILGVRPPMAAGQEQAQTQGDPEIVPLRAKLDELNAEIQALKVRSRDVRTEYLLRQRMADAESLSRRLTALEAKVHVRPAGEAPAPRLGPEPIPAPADGPAELEAKADILSDQSRRLDLEAARLAERAVAVRRRIELRRRADILDRDPFAGLEGPRRRTLRVVPDSSMRDASEDARPGAAGVSGSPPAPPAGGAVRDVAPIASRLRDLLDPTTLADVRRLEAGREPGTDARALERAAAALRARALHLAGQAQALRKQATER